LETAASGKADRDSKGHTSRRVIVPHSKVDEKNGFKTKFYNGVCTDEAIK
jgi:hypothetical protein